MERRVRFAQDEANSAHDELPPGVDPGAVTRFNIGGGGSHGHNHGHGHSHAHGGNNLEAEEDEDQVEEVSFTLSELVPGCAIRNLLVRVVEVNENGEALVESAHGRATMIYDVEKIGLMVRAGSALKIADGYGFTQETGTLAIRLEDPQEESITVEMSIDEDELTPPEDARNISAIVRLFGLLVIRENRCLLCPAVVTPGKFAFPIEEAHGDEPERTAALQAFLASTEIDMNEVYLVNEIPPVASYEEDDVISTLFVAYSRRPFKKGQPPKNTDKFSWFTFEEAMEALETEASKSCLVRIVNALDAAIASTYVKPNFGVRFGPANGDVPKVTASKIEKQEKPISVTSKPVANNDTANVPTAKLTEKPMAVTKPATPQLLDGDIVVEALLARTSALFYLNERGQLSPSDFLRLLSSSQSTCTQPQQVNERPTLTNTAPISLTESSKTEAAAVVESKSASSAQLPVPVTVICGFLGAGKTTLLNHLVTNNQNLKIALVVNDMAEVNMDAKQIQSRDNNQVVEMSNGCICCTLRDDLLTEVSNLASSGKYDYIVIESTGIGDPMGIAETFTFPLPDGRVLNDVARLDTVVTVVDASSLLRDMNLNGKKRSDENDESGRLSRLLTEQIEFADVIVMNKIDLVTVQEMNKVRAVVSSLSPASRKIECVRSAVALHDILDTKLFSFENAESCPGWLKSLRGEEVPESEEFGIKSVVWRSKYPLSPSKLAVCITKSPFTDAVIRSKGIIWLANRFGTERSVEWAGAGHSYVFYEGKPWHDGGKNTGICEVVLIGFFDDPSVPRQAMDMLDACCVEVNETTGEYDVEDDEVSIKVLQG